MKAAGCTVDKKQLEIFIKAVDGKSIPDLVKEGKKKHVSLPRGGGGGAPAAAAGAAAAEAPKEEKKEEVEDVDMGGLFGDDDDY